jgi:arylsulfatase A-like enzyme
MSADRYKVAMPRKPNVIFCVCDELRAFDVGCYGNSIIRTPNIDRLAATGVRFETVCSNNPVCTPARSILLTGQYSRTCNGATGNVGDPAGPRRHLAGTTIAEAMRSAGYDTAAIGKWHMQPSPGDVGFDRYVYPSFSHKHRGRTYFDQSDKPFETDGWTWDFDMNLARSYLANRAGADKPFFLYFNIEPPHMPLADAPEHYTKMYDPEQMVLRPNTIVDGKRVYDEHWFNIYRWDYQYYREKLPWTMEMPAGFDLPTLTAMYYGLITLVDDQIGKLVSALTRFGLLDDTLLIFTSDHGDNLGSHGKFSKQQLYEESIRVPMVFNWPAGLKTPIASTAQVAGLVDLVPTALALADVPIPTTVQGTDLSAVVRGERDTAGENVAFIETSGDDIGIRTLDHLVGVRFAGSFGGGYNPEKDRIVDDRHMFYDLRTDPYELKNRGPTSADDPIAAPLRDRLLRWHRGTPWL